MDSSRIISDGNSGIPTTHIKQWENVNKKCKITVKFTYSSNLMVSAMVSRAYF